MSPDERIILVDVIDLRSDTVTQPTLAMRKAMAEAVVGDDVYGEDPTINRLQEMAAERMGKEAGLFVPSGTMGNLIAILTSCNRGDEAIMGNLSHTFLFEAGGAAALGGVHPMTLPNQPDGTLDLEAIQAAIRGEDVHQPITRLIVLENTHNMCGGVPLRAEYTRAVGELAHRRGLRFHLDGARIFNAAVALGVEAKELARPANSVTFCLSKGLCAPVGSVLCGSQEFITRARRIRKQLGGGMRQAGILAAAGIVALEQMVDRMREDHARAKRLAKGLQGLRGLILDAEAPMTNMVYASLAEGYPGSMDELAARLEERGIRIDVEGPRLLRMVTHNDIDDEGIERTIQVFRALLGS